MAFTACHAELDAVFPIEDLPVGAGAGGGAADANYVGDGVGGGVDHVPHVVDSGVSYRGFSIWGLAQGKKTYRMDSRLCLLHRKCIAHSHWW